MKYKIRDLRNNPEAVKERDAEELAHELAFMAIFFSGPRKEIGAIIKRYRHQFNFKDIKSEHTEKDRMFDK